MNSDTITDIQPKRSFIELSRRAQIIDCAIDAIAEHGFAQASLARIAKRAGVSTGVILYHFTGKDELIRDIGTHVFGAGEAFIRPRLDLSSAPAALRSFIEASVAFIAARPQNVLAVMNILRAGPAEGGAPRLDPAASGPRAQGFTAILTQGQADGAFRPFSVRVMTATIIEALDAIPPAYAADPSLDITAYGRELVEIFDRATRLDPIEPQQEHPEP